MHFTSLVSIAKYALAIVLGLGAGTASAGCEDANYSWSQTDPSVNLRHVFCGETAGKKSKGYHSKVFAPTTDVVTGTQNKGAVDNGMYNAQVNFKTPAQAKNSTFFPDSCTEDQIVKSIVYASQNSTGPAQPWGRLGPSAPAGEVAGYCVGADKKRIVIRYALDNDGDVNTAFPSLP